MTLQSRWRSGVWSLWLGCALWCGLLGWLLATPHRAGGQANNPVAVVSAANYSAALAPASIAAVFGTGLATRTEAASSTTLPTTLAGTMVRINGELAPLFLVSPGQINLLIPPGLPAGTANIIVTASDGTVSRGTLQLVRAAPGLFTANANGSGVPAAVALRVKADGTQSFEPVADFAQTPFATRPLDLGAANEQLFLILFGTGLRGRAQLADVAVRIGGVNAAVNFAGAQGDLAGLDQVNLLLPRELLGRGRVNLALNINGFGAANLVEVEIAGAANVAPPQITGYSAATALAGQVLTINGAGFSPNAADNTVRIGGVEARIEAASATQLTIRVPFGSQSGVVSVRTLRGEGQGARTLQLRTSISGVVEDTRRQPLAGVTVRAVGRGIQAVTGAEGSFLLPDIPAAVAQELEFDGGTVPGSLPFPSVKLKKRVLASRDNQMDGPIALQQISGAGVAVDTAGAANALAAKAVASPAQIPAQSLRVGNVSFEIPAGVSISLPNGATRGTLNLTLVENNRPPVSLPPALFSTTIPQLTPFSAILLPGGKLTLPNDERYPAGMLVRLLRFDQTPNSPTIGEFVEAGTATVTADGQRIETAPNAITEITQYFVAAPRQTTTVVGRVVDSNGTTPVRQALVRCRGQEAFTDGNGGFTLRGVVANPGDTLSVEASFVRANGRVDRTQHSGIPAVVNGLTAVTTELVLPADDSNRAPVLLAPSSLAINEGETRDILFVAGDSDSGQTIRLSVTGAPFASLIERGNGVYSLRLQTRANDAGRYTLVLVASDNLNASTTLNLALVVNRLPRANAQQVTTDEDTPKAITLTANDPDGDQLTFFTVRNPTRGSLSGTPPHLLYTPTADFNGTDSFSFKVNDGVADSNEATVALFVSPVNDPPTLIVPGVQKLDTGQTLSFTLSASDIDGDTLTFTATGLPGEATFTPGATSAQFRWTPSATQYGCHNVAFTVRDNGSPPLGVTRVVAITVAPRWQQAPGPLGAQVFAFVASGGKLLAAGSGGVYQSTDQGQSWGLTSTGLTHVRAVSLVQSGSVLFAGSDGSGVFRSFDQGRTWESASVGLPAISYVSALVGGGNELFASTYGGVFRSSNQGQNWTAVNDGLTNRKVNALALSSSDLFAATDGGVFRLPNRGQRWEVFGTGLPNQPALSLLVNDGAIYVGPDRSGVFRSSTQTANWAEFNTPGLTSRTVIALAQNGAELLAGTFGGVFVSAAQSPNWAVRNQGLNNKTINTLAVLDGNLLLAGTHGGVYRTTDQGRNWAAGNAGLTGVVVNVLATAGATLFAGTNADGVQRSIEQGRSWQAANGNPAETHLESRTVPALLVTGGVLYAGTDNGVYASADSGASWTERNNGLPLARYTNALIVSGASLFAGTNSGAFRSDNQGQSWIEVNNGLTERDVRAMTTLGLTIFAGTEDRGVFRSFDQGGSWTPVNNGLGILRVHALTTAGVTLYAGTGSGVYRSDNQGQSWTRVSTGLPAGAFVNTLLVNGSNLFAGIFGGVFMSCDQGANWMPAVTGLTHQNVFSLAALGSRLFAGTIGGGVFISQ